MSWLSDWLKQVILVVLLASFVDLLLPNQAMQRYVRTVLSLFLLLALLTPVFELFEKGWSAEKVIREAASLQDNGRRTAALQASGSTAGDGKLRPLAGILEDSERLKRDGAEQAVKLAEARLSEEVRKSLEARTGAAVKEVTVDLAVDNKGNPEIRQIRATLSHKKGQAPGEASASVGGNSSGSVSVKEVQPVTVDIRPDAEERRGDKAAMKGSPVPGVLPVSDAGLRDAARYLESEWAIPKERIQLVYEP